METTKMFTKQDQVKKIVKEILSTVDVVEHKEHKDYGCSGYIIRMSSGWRLWIFESLKCEPETCEFQYSLIMAEVDTMNLLDKSNKLPIEVVTEVNKIDKIFINNNLRQRFL